MEQDSRLCGRVSYIQPDLAGGGCGLLGMGPDERLPGIPGMGWGM